MKLIVRLWLCFWITLIISDKLKKKKKLIERIFFFVSSDDFPELLNISLDFNLSYTLKFSYFFGMASLRLSVWDWNPSRSLSALWWKEFSKRPTGLNSGQKVLNTRVEVLYSIPSSQGDTWTKMVKVEK